MRTLRTMLVGAHGHGRAHLANVRRLAERSPIELVAVCDPRPLDPEMHELVGDVAMGDDMPLLLAATEPDVTIVCTPIHTHVDLALEAARAGSHVLLEKPPAPTFASYRRLCEGLADADRVCQIGFQSLGSHAVTAIRELVSDGAVGDVVGIGAAGAWVRDATYYDRSPWAGRRSLDGRPVVDGALTNPFAHAVATALRIDDSEGPDAVHTIDVELYRANAIEADDTSSLRVRTSRGTTIVVAVTLCAERDHDPYVVVHGSRGRITLWYKRHEVRVESDAGVVRRTYPTTDLLENLVAHLADPAATPLLVPPDRVHAFMEVLEAVRTASEPVRVAARHRRLDRSGEHDRHVIPGVDAATDACAERLVSFSELGLPWAVPAASARS